MDDRELHSRLSLISTRWTLLKAAHDPAQDDRALRAQSDMMERYLGAVYRYLSAAVRSPDLADDLTQEFALRFLSGRFRSVDSGRGRFRDYLKTCLFHLVDDHFRGQRKVPRPGLTAEAEVVDSHPQVSDFDAIFLQSWRSELLAKAWAALAREEQQTGQPFHTVLQLRVQQPQAPSGALAEQLTVSLGRPMTAENFRQTLRRSRERFAASLFDEISQSLGTCSRVEIAAELADLDLLRYCQQILDRTT